MKTIFSNSRADLFLLILIGIVLCVEFLTSLAPLTGSDAMHYHFTAQKLILENGFHPDFSVSRSFFCGQHHLLILFGLAPGSEQLAMGLIFLGGVLTAFSQACLASRWLSSRTALAITLLFLLTPVVFWQISSSGAPDIWMKGDLVPVAQVAVQDFQGKRIQGKRAEFPVVILRGKSFVGN